MTGTWSLADSARLVAAAYGWLLGVTLPGACLLGALVVVTPSTWAFASSPLDAFTGLGSLAVWMIPLDLVTAAVAFFAAAGAVPFTYVLGVLVRPVQSRPAHVLASAGLGAASAWVSASWATGSPLFGTLMAVAAGGAAAIARHRQLLRTPRRTTDSAEIAPSVASGGGPADDDCDLGGSGGVR